jgi:hypothetical protein
MHATHPEHVRELSILLNDSLTARQVLVDRAYAMGVECGHGEAGGAGHGYEVQKAELEAEFLRGVEAGKAIAAEDAKVAAALRGGSSAIPMIADDMSGLQMRIEGAGLDDPLGDHLGGPPGGGAGVDHTPPPPLVLEGDAVGGDKSEAAGERVQDAG